MEPRCAVRRELLPLVPAPLGAEAARQFFLVLFFFLIAQFRLMLANRKQRVACLHAELRIHCGISSYNKDPGGKVCPEPDPPGGVLPRPPGLPGRVPSPAEDLLLTAPAPGSRGASSRSRAGSSPPSPHTVQRFLKLWAQLFRVNAAVLAQLTLTTLIPFIVNKFWNYTES